MIFPVGQHAHQILPITHEAVVLERGRVVHHVEVNSMKRQRHRKIIYMEVAAFSLIICVSWSNELFNFSGFLFGGDYSSNWHEALFESCITILVAFPTIYLTWRILKRLHYLEDFLKICAWCRKINSHGQWYELEEYFRKEHETKTTHGLCPTCSEKMKNEE